MAVLISGERVLAPTVFPAPTPIFAKCAISSVSEGTVGENCSTKFRMLKNSSDFLSSSGVSGLMKSIAGAAVGAGWPRNADSGSALYPAPVVGVRAYRHDRSGYRCNICS